MEQPARPTVDHLKEIAWAILMIDLVLGLLALLFLPHFGALYTLWTFGGLAAMITAIIGGLAVVNVAWVLLGEGLRRRAARRGTHGSAKSRSQSELPNPTSPSDRV